MGDRKRKAKAKARKPKTILAWHFLYACRDHEHGKLRDGTTPPADGAWLQHSGDVLLCVRGLHASKKLHHALHYAPGPIVCRVECGGTIVEVNDKLVCSRRRILWRADASEVLRQFALGVARRAVAAEWKKPPKVVRDYLETGAEALRVRAHNAATLTTPSPKATRDATALARYASCESFMTAAKFCRGRGPGANAELMRLIMMLKPEGR